MKQNILKNIIICFLVFLYGGVVLGKGPLKISTFEPQLNQAYVICNIRDLDSLSYAHTAKEEQIFPVLRLGAFYALQINNQPVANKAACNQFLLPIKAQDASLYWGLPGGVAEYFKKRFYRLRTIAPICWYLNVSPLSQTIKEYKVVTFGTPVDSAVLTILKSSRLAQDLLVFDFSSIRELPLTVAQKLLLEQLFYSFLSERLTRGVYQMESPLQFLGSATVPLYMPDFIITGNQNSMESLLKKWPKIEASFLEDLSVKQIKMVQQKLKRQLFLLTSEPLPRLTLMIKLLAKYGYLHSVNTLQKQIGEVDVSLFFKKVADTFRHSSYQTFWLTGNPAAKSTLSLKTIRIKQNVNRRAERLK